MIIEPQPLLKFRARARFNADQHGEWKRFEAYNAGEAAKQLVFKSGATSYSINAGGRLPVEVVEDGTIKVRRFEVIYLVQYEVVEHNYNRRLNSEPTTDAVAD